MRNKSILILLIFAFPFLMFSQNIKVSATTDSLEYNIGDYIDFKVKVQSPKYFTTQIPELADSLAPFLLIKKGKIETKISGDVKDEIHHFVISGYDSLDTMLKPIVVNFYNDKKELVATEKTNQLRIVVNSIDVDLQKEIKNIKAPITIPMNLKEIGIYSGIGILILVLAYFIYRRYFKTKNEAESVRKIILPPYKIALKKLTELETEKLWQSGKIKEFHSKITGIIREFFEGEYKFNSLEMTSQETVRELEKRNVDLNNISIIREFLSNADMVKFAKFTPMPEINELMLKQAFQLVNENKIKVESEIEGEKL